MKRKYNVPTFSVNEIIVDVLLMSIGTEEKGDNRFDYGEFN